jgi:hypothetical protein
MRNWEQQIEEDLGWRESEMASLKLLLASSITGSDRQRALLRACSAMLYAHYEGFCKFCWALLLEEVGRQRPRKQDLVAALEKRAMADVLRQLRGNMCDDNIWLFATKTFHDARHAVASSFEEVDTQSNLWPDLAERINSSVGLECPLFSTHKSELKQLVGRRNKIAHGAKLEIEDLEQFQKLEHAAVIVMHELALAVADSLSRKSYLRQPADPAALI